MAETETVKVDLGVVFLLAPSIQKMPGTPASFGRSGLILNDGLNVGAFGKPELARGTLMQFPFIH